MKRVGELHRVVGMTSCPPEFAASAPCRRHHVMWRTAHAPVFLAERVESGKILDKRRIVNTKSASCREC
jgi:hypothetical protein